MRISQFGGESRRDAIINHYGLDIEEEDDFFEMLKDLEVPIDSDDELIDRVYKYFRETE